MPDWFRRHIPWCELPPKGCFSVRRTGCGPKFCSMCGITQQVRDYAAKLAEKERVSSSEAVDLARERGMEEMSAKFRAAGAQVYVAED